MPKATNDASTANVVEADAFIVRDPEGRKRILIGNLWPAGSGEWYPGVALYDEHGSERVCLLLGDGGPVLSFAERGDTRLEIGLRDREPAGVGSMACLVAEGGPGEIVGFAPEESPQPR